MEKSRYNRVAVSHTVVPSPENIRRGTRRREEIRDDPYGGGQRLERIWYDGMRCLRNGCQEEEIDAEPDSGTYKEKPGRRSRPSDLGMGTELPLTNRTEFLYERSSFLAGRTRRDHLQWKVVMTGREERSAKDRIVSRTLSVSFLRISCRESGVTDRIDQTHNDSRHGQAQNRSCMLMNLTLRLSS